MSRDGLPVYELEPVSSGRSSRDTTVRGVLLAAGTSSRYGAENKLLEDLDGCPLVRHAAMTLVESDVDGVTVVVGYEQEQVRRALADLDLEFRENDEYAAGQSTSVQKGVRRASEHGADAVLIALGDMPRVSSDTVDLLLRAYDRGVAAILAAAYDGRRGNPVLFDERFFDALTDVEGDTGGRQLLCESEEAVAVETDDTGVTTDVDRPRDLSKFE